MDCLKHSDNDSNEEDEGERGVHVTGMVTPEENISIKIWTLVSSSLQHYQGLSLQQQRLYCFPLSWISWQRLGQAQAVWNSSVSSSAWQRCSSSVIFLGKHLLYRFYILQSSHSHVVMSLAVRSQF